jgi:predicted HNH restriction endonuclease
MADDVREFSKDNPPDPGTGSWYRSTKMVFATRVEGDAKVGGKKHRDGFVVDDDPHGGKGKYKFFEVADFNEEFMPAQPNDPIPRPQGPHFDAIKASEDQATGFQFDGRVEGDDAAARQIETHT